MGSVRYKKKHDYIYRFSFFYVYALCQILQSVVWPLQIFADFDRRWYVVPWPPQRLYLSGSAKYIIRLGHRFNNEVRFHEVGTRDWYIFGINGRIFLWTFGARISRVFRVMRAEARRWNGRDLCFSKPCLNLKNIKTKVFYDKDTLV